MKQDIVISVVVHLLFLTTALISSPFEPKNAIDYGEVIRVSLPSADQIPQAAPEVEIPPEPKPAPKPTKVETPEVPIETPAQEEVVKIETPKEKPEEKPEPEPKKETRKVPLPEEASTGSTDQGGNKESQVDVEATAASGTVLSGATVDNASFNYPYWFTQAFYKISANHRNPVNYDGTLVCVVYFEVMQSGRVYGLRVEQTSGFDAFDRACLAAIERSTPLPPLPREFLAEVISITLPFKTTPR